MVERAHEVGMQLASSVGGRRQRNSVRSRASLPCMCMGQYAHSPQLEQPLAQHMAGAAHRCRALRLREEREHTWALDGNRHLRGTPLGDKLRSREELPLDIDARPCSGGHDKVQRQARELGGWVGNNPYPQSADY